VGLLTALSAHRGRIVLGVLLWELALTGVLLQSYTPALHLSAFATGLIAGILLSRPAQETDRLSPSGPPSTAGVEADASSNAR
jgi:hypothetical protein